MMEDRVEKKESDQSQQLPSSRTIIFECKPCDQSQELPISCKSMIEEDIKDDTESEEFDRSQERPRSKTTIEDDLKVKTFDQPQELSSCNSMIGDVLEREEYDETVKRYNIDFDQSRELSSFKREDFDETMSRYDVEFDQSQEDLSSCQTTIVDDTESEEFVPSQELPTFRSWKKSAFKFGSSLDLIYGRREAAPYFVDGPLCANSGRRSSFGYSSELQQNQDIRISMNPIEMKADCIEAFFYNRGMEIAMGVLYFALNYLVAAHGAYQFTEAGGWTTDNDMMRITVPIARAGGRLVTLNCAMLLLTACKYFWTLVRTYVAPVIPIGFPIDDVMPKYHRYVALTIIIAGCVIHALPQIVNYASKSISMDHDGTRIWTLWTFGIGFAAKQLLVTGTLLTVIFSTFYLTTLKAFRKTAAGFRWFWFFHVGGIATAYPLLLLHGTCRGHPVFFYVALVPLLLYLFDLFMRRFNISTANIIEFKTYKDQEQEITELVVECPLNFVYTPGQYVELKFLPI